jgi:hypothetical protein
MFGNERKSLCAQYERCPDQRIAKKAIVCSVHVTRNGIIPRSAYVAELGRVDTGHKRVNNLCAHRGLKVGLEKVHVLRNYHTNLHDLNVVLNCVRFTKVNS